MTVSIPEARGAPTLNSTITINESVVSAELEGEAVLLDIESGIYFGLDELGSAIWKLLEEGASLADVEAKLLQDYDVDPVQLRSDLSDFVAALSEAGLVRVTPL